MRRIWCTSCVKPTSRLSALNYVLLSETLSTPAEVNTRIQNAEIALRSTNFEFVSDTCAIKSHPNETEWTQ